MKILTQILIFIFIVTQICFGQWYQQNSGINQNLYSVHFIDTKAGFAAGDTGIIINTGDGGKTWKPQISGTEANLKDIFFIDSSKGWVVGCTEYAPQIDGTLLFTSDAGMNWTTLWTKENVTLHSIYFIDSLRGWVVGADSIRESEIWFTADGGFTWTSQYKGEAHTILFSIYFIDSFNGWAGGRTYSSSVQAPLLKTTNGGVDWNYVTNVPQYLDAYSIHFTDINNGWIVGEGNVTQTTDGGDSWITNDSLFRMRGGDISVYFTDLNNGWIVGHSALGTYIGARITHTTNSGNDWTTEFFETGIGLFDVFFIDSLTGWVTGNKGLILHTTNGGVSFVEEERIDEMPIEFILSQNYPNPFNPTTSIQYSINSRQFVKLIVYDLLGREIETLVNEEKPAGTYELNWNAANLPSGVYFYQLRAGSFVETKKMILIK